MCARCEVRRDDNYMYKSGPADEKWTKPDLSSRTAIYGGLQARWDD